MRRSSSALALLLAAAVALVGCMANGDGGTEVNPRTPKASRARQPEVTDVTAQDYVMPPLPAAQVVLTDAFGGKHGVQVEVAATEEARTRGMMWRTSLAKGRGMLFVFPEEEFRSFWMRNTLIPLDMVFIAADGTIVGIVPRAEPKTLGSRAVDADSKYVLELPGGWTEEIGLRPGSKVELRGVSQLEVR